MTELFQDKISVQFVLNVLRQHEMEFDRLIADLGVLVEKVDYVANKMEENSRK